MRSPLITIIVPDGTVILLISTSTTLYQRPRLISRTLPSASEKPSKKRPVTFLRLSDPTSSRYTTSVAKPTACSSPKPLTIRTSLCTGLHTSLSVDPAKFPSLFRKLVRKIPFTATVLRTSTICVQSYTTSPTTLLTSSTKPVRNLLSCLLSYEPLPT